jgi:hypothetical protein
LIEHNKITPQSGAYALKLIPNISAGTPGIYKCRIRKKAPFGTFKERLCDYFPEESTSVTRVTVPKEQLRIYLHK